MTKETEKVTIGFESIAKLIAGALTIIFYLGILFFFSLQLTAMILALALLILFPISILSDKLVYKLRKEHNLGELRLNIATIWSGDELMADDIATSGYKEKDLQYLKENWSEQIMGKSKWDFDDCFWVKNGLYTTVDGNVLACCMNTGAKPFGNLFTDSTNRF